MAIVLTVLFLALMIGIGFWGMRKTQTLNDFFLGGRTVGPWVSAFAYGTSYFSAVLFVGFAGKLGWLFGLNVLWIAIGNAIFGSFFAWMVLGRRTRRMTQNLDVMTMPEFFETRYEAPRMKILAAIIIFIFLVPYSASVYKGLGHVFESSFGISYDAALITMTAITGIYLILGGYFAVTLTDFIQGFIMIIGSTMMVAILVNKGGGMETVLEELRVAHQAHVPDAPPWWALLALVFMTSFGTWGLPQMIHKFYAISDERQITRAAVVTMVFAMIVGLAAYFTGSMTHIFYDKLPEGTNPFDVLIPQLLTTHLPELLMAVIVVLILSASMSTLSSLVLVSSSAVAIDLYKGHVNPQISSKNSLAMMRFLSAVFIVISYLIARYQFAFIVTLMSLSWGAIAGAFLAPYLLGLFWRRVTKYGAYAGMISGLSIVLGGFFWLGESYGKLSPVVASIAMLVPFIVVPVVSLMTRPPSEETLKIAFAKDDDLP